LFDDGPTTTVKNQKQFKNNQIEKSTLMLLGVREQMIFLTTVDQHNQPPENLDYL
jgi:hypothetical protein